MAGVLGITAQELIDGALVAMIGAVVVGLVAVGMRVLGRVFGRGIKDEIRDLVRTEVKAVIKEDLDSLRNEFRTFVMENSTQHAGVQGRVGVLEQEMADLREDIRAERQALDDRLRDLEARLAEFMSFMGMDGRVQEVS